MPSHQLAMDRSAQVTNAEARPFDWSLNPPLLYPQLTHLAGSSFKPDEEASDRINPEQSHGVNDEGQHESRHTPVQEHLLIG